MLGIFAVQTPAQKKTPKITFKETKHDFGKVKQGVILTHLFKFKNDGDENLIIQKVQPSCGCTGATIGNKKEFNKDETGEIKVTFNTSGRWGKQSKTITVKSNDPVNPNVVLSFTCEITSKLADQTPALKKTPKITFKETRYDFGKVKQGVTLTHLFKFKNEGDGNLIIEKVKPSCGCTGATIGNKKVFKKNETGEIKVTFNTGGRSGKQRKTVKIQSNDSINPNIVLSFTCEIISKKQNLTNTIK